MNTIFSFLGEEPFLEAEVNGNGDDEKDEDGADR